MWKRLGAVTGIACLVATALAICFAARSHYLGEHGHFIYWRWALLDYMTFWWGWGLQAGVLGLLVQRFPLRRRPLRYWPFHAAASAIASPLHALFWCVVVRVIARYVMHQPTPWNLVGRTGECVISLYPEGIVYYFLVISIFHAITYYRQFEERSLAASLLEAQLAQTKLHLLKTQLHPHFLFNTLNSISALLHEDVEQADLMIERLGDFLRLTLENSTTQEITLREELDFLNCYLSIEQIRLQDRLRSEVHVEPQVLDARVPSLILQPIVENAIRHGIAPRFSQGHLEIQAKRGHAGLLITVRDNGPGLRACPPERAGKGMGLHITRARLERLYGTRQRLELANAPEGGVLVTLEIPFACTTT